MEKRAPKTTVSRSAKSTTNEQQEKQKAGRKLSEYGKQLAEKQKVKRTYGMREKQFRRFFSMAAEQRQGATGEVLLSLCERRLDNVIYRLKMATSRIQARQVIVHGHILVNGHKVSSPSYLLSVGDEVSLKPNVLDKKVFYEQVFSKRLNLGIKVPEWLELDKSKCTGRILRDPKRTDVQTPVDESLIVELYSK
jgi:small subunit ribosomal protein S4